MLLTFFLLGINYDYGKSTTKKTLNHFITLKS